MRKLVWIINAAEVVKTVKAGKKLQGVIAWDDKLELRLTRRRCCVVWILAE